MLNRVYPILHWAYDTIIHHSSILSFLSYIDYGNLSTTKSKKIRNKKDIKAVHRH